MRSLWNVGLRISFYGYVSMCVISCVCIPNVMVWSLFSTSCSQIWFYPLKQQSCSKIDFWKISEPSIIYKYIRQHILKHLFLIYSWQNDPHGRILPAKNRDPVLHDPSRRCPLRNGRKRFVLREQPLHWWRQKRTSPMGMVLRHQKRLEGLSLAV